MKRALPAVQTADTKRVKLASDMAAPCFQACARLVIALIIATGVLHDMESVIFQQICKIPMFGRPRLKRGKMSTDGYANILPLQWKAPVNLLTAKTAVLSNTSGEQAIGFKFLQTLLEQKPTWQCLQLDNFSLRGGDFAQLAAAQPFLKTLIIKNGPVVFNIATTDPFVATSTDTMGLLLPPNRGPFETKIFCTSNEFPFMLSEHVTHADVVLLTPTSVPTYAVNNIKTLEIVIPPDHRTQHTPADIHHVLCMCRYLTILAFKSVSRHSRFIFARMDESLNKMFAQSSNMLAGLQQLEFTSLFLPVILQHTPTLKTLVIRFLDCTAFDWQKIANSVPQLQNLHLFGCINVDISCLLRSFNGRLEELGISDGRDHNTIAQELMHLPRDLQHMLAPRLLLDAGSVLRLILARVAGDSRRTEHQDICQRISGIHVNVAPHKHTRGSSKAIADFLVKRVLSILLGPRPPVVNAEPTHARDNDGEFLLDFQTTRSLGTSVCEPEKTLEHQVRQCLKQRVGDGPDMSSICLQNPSPEALLCIIALPNVDRLVVFGRCSNVPGIEDALMQYLETKFPKFHGLWKH